MLEVATGRISNDLIIKKNWRELIESHSTSGDEYVFGADAIAVPDYGIFGVAYSNRKFDHHPLDQRYVQLALDTIRAGLATHSPETETDSQFLGDLLLPVGQAFAELDVPPDDWRAAPWVRITLARLQGNRLSYARMGDVRIYVIEAERCLEIPPWWPKSIGREVLAPGVGLSDMELTEWEPKPGELVIVATFSMEKVIHGANLSELVRQGVCDAQVVNQRLIDTLRSLPGSLADPHGSGPGQRTEKRILSWGAAWAIACVEANEDIPQEKATSKRRPRKVERPTHPHQEESAPMEFNLWLRQVS